MILNTVAFAPFPDSLLSGCVAFCQDPRRFIPRLKGRPGLWCCCRLAMTSNKYWCLPSEYFHQRRSCQKRRRTTRVYVTIREETANVRPNENYTTGFPQTIYVKNISFRNAGQ